jgi:NAD+ synthase (glutamine-hydrolysing)
LADIEKNSTLICSKIEEAKALDVDIIAFPELAVTGYPPEDLLYKPHFIKQNLEAIETIAQSCEGIIAVIGFIDASSDLYNALALIDNGEIKAIYHKQHLPNYGLFDEERYFQAGQDNLLLEIDDKKIGFSICEDIWQSDNPIESLAAHGAELIININASPFSCSKQNVRHDMLKTRARDNLVHIAYVNCVGGQDELVFDGASMIVNPKGEITSHAHSFQEELLIQDIALESTFRMQLKDSRLKKLRQTATDRCITTLKSDATLHNHPYTMPHTLHPSSNYLENIYSALTLGLKDYIRKNGFSKVVIGLSGGIDSALTAAIAVDALGKENVVGILMPSEFSSDHSVSDADALAKNLGITTHTIAIKEMFESFDNALNPLFGNLPFDTTEENLQARIRGTLLMATSNKFNWIVVSTGNKSEISVGYSTLYGDMVGGFSLLKDVLKTTVFKLCHFRNSLGLVIPENTITKPPSAELRPDQLDSDSLPDYEVLDRIIKLYVEEDYSLLEIIESGIDEKVAKKMTWLIDINEYKRCQAPVGVRISERAFGKDRRMPITNGFKK